MNLMHHFTKSDWMCYSGAKKFPDGEDPYVGEYGPLTVIVDGDGLQAFLMDYETDAACIGREGTEYLLDVAERILADCKGLSPRQMLRHLAEI